MFFYKCKNQNLIAKIFLFIAITFNLVFNHNKYNYVIAQELMHSSSDNNTNSDNNNNNDNKNEEITISNFDEIFELQHQQQQHQQQHQQQYNRNDENVIKEFQQQQQQRHKKLWNDNVSLNKSNLDNSNNRYSSLSKERHDEHATEENDYTTTPSAAAAAPVTIVPLADYIQMFSTLLPLSQSSSSPSLSPSSSSSSISVTSSSILVNNNNNSDKDNNYMKENESRLSALLEETNITSTTTTASTSSYSMQNNVYRPQLKNINIDNDRKSSVNNLSISIENDTVSMVSYNSSNNNENENDNKNNNNDSDSDNINVTDSASLFSSPIASPYIATLSSNEDYSNESQMLGMISINDDADDDDGEVDFNSDSDIVDQQKRNNKNISDNNLHLIHRHHDPHNDRHHDHQINNDDDTFIETINGHQTNDGSDLANIEQFDSIEDITTTLTTIPTIIPSTASITTMKAITSTATTNALLRTKQGKQIQIIKLLPHEALRNFIEDAYIRTPLAILVDTSSNSLDKTKTLWKDSLRSNTVLDVVLLAFNASGVSVTYHFQNTRNLLAGLGSIQESTNEGNAFFAIIRACELIPYDSAIFISTASIPADINLAQYAAITLLKKRIRLYLIWFGDNVFSENETQEVTGGILGEVAIRSGGEILHIGNDTKFEDDNMLTLISENYQGNQELDIPIETTMSNLHIKVDTMMRTATLVTPNGAEVNLQYPYNNTSRKININQMKSSIYNNIQGFNIIIPLKKINYPTQFHLKLIPNDNNKMYKILVKAKENDDIENLQDYETSDVIDDDIDLQTLNLERSERKLKNFDNLSKKQHKTILTHDNIRFPDENLNFENINCTAINISDNLIKNNKLEKNSKQIGPTINQGITKISLGVQSQLLVNPGMVAQIYYEITNTRTETVFHNIRVTDDRGFLLSLNPTRLLLPPGQTTTVFLSVIIPAGTAQGTTDKITLTCQGNGQASQSLELKVISPSDVQDSTAPYITWVFGTRCSGSNQYGTAACSQRVWSLEITVRDWETGILRVESTPIGILPRIPYTAGTTEPIRLAYSASCCQPRVTISAYDLAGNQRTQTIDVRDIVLTEASIAAIVLGILLLIALIALIVIGTIWCCRKRKRSQDLSSYRSNPERTR